MNIVNEITKLWGKVSQVGARVDAVITPGGQIRVSEDTIAGGIWAHDHLDTLGGGNVEYSPATLGDWLGGLDPGNVPQALDQLARRIKAIENLSLPVAVYPASTMLFNGIEG